MTAYPHLTAGEPGFHAEESMTLRCQPPMFQINGAHQLRMVARVQLPLGPLQRRTTIKEIKLSRYMESGLFAPQTATHLEGQDRNPDFRIHESSCVSITSRISICT